MRPGKSKSRSLRRVFVKTPGGKTVLHFLARKPSPAKCSVTGQRLHGVPCMKPNKLGKLPKSQRRPNRPFGGVLSSKAMRVFFRNKARELFK